MTRKPRHTYDELLGEVKLLENHIAVLQASRADTEAKLKREIDSLKLELNRAKISSGSLGFANMASSQTVGASRFVTSIPASLQDIGPSATASRFSSPLSSNTRVPSSSGNDAGPSRTATIDITASSPEIASGDADSRSASEFRTPTQGLTRSVPYVSVPPLAQRYTSVSVERAPKRSASRQNVGPPRRSARRDVSPTENNKRRKKSATVQHDDDDELSVLTSLESDHEEDDSYEPSPTDFRDAPAMAPGLDLMHNDEPAPPGPQDTPAVPEEPETAPDDEPAPPEDHSATEAIGAVTPPGSEKIIRVKKSSQSPQKLELWHSSPPSTPIKGMKAKKGKALDLPPAFISECLKGVTAYTIEPPPPDFFAPRASINAHFGGNFQQVVVKFSKNIPWQKGETHNVIFPGLKLNPLLPKEPGAPGCVFTSRNDILEGGVKSVFVDVPRGKNATWTYMGEYEFSIGGTISKSLFSQQTSEVQTHWVKHINKSKHKCYVSMKARISMRLKNIPVDDTEGYLEEIDSFEHEKNPEPLSPHKIRDALIMGEEHLDILKMNCVGYDHKLLAAMQKQLPHSVTTGQLKMQQQDQQAGSSSNAGESKRPRKQKKRDDEWY